MYRTTRRRVLLLLSSLSIAKYPNVILAEQTAEIPSHDWIAVYLSCCKFLLSGSSILTDEALDFLLTRAKREAEQSIEFERQLKNGLMLFQSVPVTTLETAFPQILQSKTVEGDFLRKLQRFVLNSFYSSQFGWEELGFEYPPQPYGFTTIVDESA